MNLECLNDIITDNLAIYIDLTDIKSWVEWNTGLTAFSLTKWSGAISDNITLADFGLTGFDNGRIDAMWSGISFTSKDTLFSVYRVGYNEVQNPTTGQTSGVTVTTQYLPMSATSATGGSLIYFALNGGYLQGFFKLHGFNYELFPARYNKGITIETLVYLYPDSHGIFYMMGLRAEDKYNPYFSGETITGVSTTANVETITGIPSSTTTISNITTNGVTTSFDNYLDSFAETKVLKKAFRSFEDRYGTAYVELPITGNTKNNVIAFELTQDKRIAYKYINNNGSIITNASPAVVTSTGFTMIAISFMPNYFVELPWLLECEPQRLGKLIFYVNGRAIWVIHDFPEFYFSALNNDKEKQEGVPYSISWGGGSFGLKNSWHYDYQTYGLYTGQDTAYINDKFFVEPDPIETECYTPPTGDTHLEGLSLSADTSTFKIIDKCDPATTHNLTVMRIEYTGETGTTTGKTYFVKFNQPISVLSNRDYTIDLSVFNDGFFKTADASGHTIQNKISVLVYGTTDVNILNETEYIYPLTSADITALSNLNNFGLYPYDPDRQEYEYIRNGILYYGDTGIPITDIFAFLYGYDVYNHITQQTMHGAIVTGERNWKPMRTTFRTEDNSGQQFVYIGLLIETSDSFNSDSPLFVTNFTYTGADILVQDKRKNNLTIEQNFDSGFIGGIQKLRIYDRAFTAPEILHNALIEAKKNPALNLLISKGGRIIYR